MSLTTAQYIDIRDPDTYASLVAASRLDNLIEVAAEQLSATVYGDRYELAVALLVLHWEAMRNRGGVGGAVLSERQGQVARQYSGGSGSFGSLKNDLEATAWGQELASLRMKTPAGFSPMNRMITR